MDLRIRMKKTVEITPITASVNATSGAPIMMYRNIVMGAPDVAFTEAVIGVISTVFFIIILRSVSRKTKDTDDKK